MKNLMVILLFGLLTMNVQGQWYSRSFGVESINDLNETQLKYALQRAQANVKTGKILTFSGIGAFTLGTIIAANSLDEFWTGMDESDFDQYVVGSVLMLLGIGSTLVGVPFWIAGASRRTQVEVALLKFSSSAYTGFRQPEQLGLSVKINF